MTGNNYDADIAAALKCVQQTVDHLKERCNFLDRQVLEQQKIIEELYPKASYYDTILQCKDLITVTSIAKDYGMSARGLNKVLYDLGVQYKQGDTWVLYAQYQKHDYMRGKTHSYTGSEGETHATGHSYWTPKGRIFLYQMLKQNGILPLAEKAEHEGETKLCIMNRDSDHV